MLRLKGGPGSICPLSFPPSDDRTEVGRTAGIDEPQSAVEVYPPLTLEVSLSDRERPMTIFHFVDMLQMVRSVVDEFRHAFS
jgi:hypothetical protein